MATFKKYSGQATTAGSTIYTVPGATTGVVLGLSLANISGNAETVSVLVDTEYLIKDAPLGAGSSLTPFEGKVVVETGSTITVSASNDSAIDVIISVLEQ